jgi:hypothetical protein
VRFFFPCGLTFAIFFSLFSNAASSWSASTICVPEATTGAVDLGARRPIAKTVQLLAHRGCSRVRVTNCCARASRLLIKTQQATDQAYLQCHAVIRSELFTEGDHDGAAVWRRILHAVEERQRTKPKANERVN